MSIFWDHRRKSPQMWTYPVFIFLTIGTFAAIYMYGLKKASEMPDKVGNEQAQNVYKL